MRVRLLANKTPIAYVSSAAYSRHTVADTWGKLLNRPRRITRRQRRQSKLCPRVRGGRRRRSSHGARRRRPLLLRWGCLVRRTAVYMSCPAERSITGGQVIHGLHGRLDHLEGDLSVRDHLRLLIGCRPPQHLLVVVPKGREVSAAHRALKHGHRVRRRGTFNNREERPQLLRLRHGRPRRTHERAFLVAVSVTRPP